MDRSIKTMYYLSGPNYICKVTAHRDGHDPDEWWWIIDTFPPEASEFLFQGMTIGPKGLTETPEQAVNDYLVATRRQINSYMRQIETFTKKEKSVRTALTKFLLEIERQDVSKKGDTNE